jgi:Tol biopolymer transport system component
MTVGLHRRIGAYELLAMLGAGGMGEVYRARDLRLDRDVAIKLLPRALADDPDRLRRFEHEARTTAALNDPHIVAIHDIGTHFGQPYIVSEFVDGETLRTMLAGGPLPVRKAIPLARQMVQGMATAHRYGIVHRDLKPENLIVTRDGVLKILDFGLAKARDHHPHLPGDSSTTAEGMIVGTVGYMSPEQARGEATDERTDIFSFGVVLYEMLTGRRAFQRGTPADTLSAVLNESPPDIGDIVSGLPPGLARIVDHCLEKSRDERFQSAADIGFALDSISGPSAVSAPQPARAWGAWRWIAVGLLVAVAAVGSFTAGRLQHVPEPLRFHQLTFRRGTVQAARFASDDRTIVYAAAWEGRPTELFSTLPRSAEARSLQMASTGLFALSSGGEMALALKPRGFGRVEGTLARAALAGGLPRELLENVVAADWFPDGEGLAVAHESPGGTKLEYPIGHTLYDPSPGHITHLRFSPSGDAIAVISHPLSGDAAGSIVLVDRQGQARTLSAGWNSVLGLAWSPDGQEIWFTGTRTGAAQALHAVTRTGVERLLYAAPATLTLHDVSRDGRVLLSRDAWGAGVMALAPGGTGELDLSWLDGSMAWDISADGTTLLLEESWEGGGAAHSIYLRPTNGSPATRLGEGLPLALSPDKQWVLATTVAADRLLLVPTGIGQPKALPPGRVTSISPDARWLPDGRGFLFAGTEARRPSRVYLQAIDGGEPRPVTPEGVFGPIAVLPDGRGLVAKGTDGTCGMYSLDGAGPRPLYGQSSGDVPLVASGDGEWLYVGNDRDQHGEIARIGLRSGRREAVRALRPPDPAGITSILRVVMTPDGRSYAYTFVRALSALYVIEGIE